MEADFIIVLWAQAVHLKEHQNKIQIVDYVLNYHEIQPHKPSVGRAEALSRKAFNKDLLHNQTWYSGIVYIQIAISQYRQKIYGQKCVNISLPFLFEQCVILTLDAFKAYLSSTIDLFVLHVRINPSLFSCKLRPGSVCWPLMVVQISQ